MNARKALTEAQMGKDLTDLKAAVNEFEGQGLYETDGTYGKAARKLEYLELAKGNELLYTAKLKRLFATPGFVQLLVMSTN